MKLITILLFIALVAYPASSFKILGVFHTMARSHYIVGSSLIDGLIEAGHDVTLISAFPHKTKPKNLREIEITGLLDAAKNSLLPNLLDMHSMSIPQMFTSMYHMGINICNHTLLHPDVQKLIKSNEKFDVVITEMFMSEALLGFGHVFNAPVIGVSTFGASKWTNDLVGNPSPPSYVPHPFLSFTDKMNFIERFGNTMMTIFENTYINYVYMPKEESIYEAAFPNPKPKLNEIMKQTSLVLLNTHVTLAFPRPYVPNMIEVGGMHIKRTNKPLPENIKNFIESSKHGVIYFSLGSNLKSSQLPVEKRDALLKVFSKLKQNILWKWEDENLPGKPKNVLISSWFPQDDILAHPSIKLFITHGGLLSTTEATYYGVPVIGIPIFGDQELNMARTEKAGYGLIVSYSNLTEQSISWAINEMIGTNKYNENAKLISARYRDQPKTPLETAIFWVEYVCRHKGAYHLQSASQQLNCWQYHNLDVVALLLFIPVFLLYVIYSLLRKCFSKKSESKTETKSKKKRN